jgi:hypothetical protein
VIDEDRRRAEIGQAHVGSVLKSATKNWRSANDGVSSVSSRT